MKQYRLNRMFHPQSGNCLDVAIDHGIFHERSFLKGIEDIEACIDILIDCNPDAIQLAVGQADVLQGRPGKSKPALVLRCDVANVYNKVLPRTLFCRMIDQPVEQALRLDAACVVVNLFAIPEQPEVMAQCIENIVALKPECDRFGMPMMVEPLVFRENSEAGGYLVDGDVDKILPVVRQATELGADVIKADPTTDPTDFRHVVQIARVPVLVRGGGRANDLELLQRTVEILKTGVRGLVYGRNIIQHEKPAAMTRALMEIVHENVSVERAAENL